MDAVASEDDNNAMVDERADPKRPDRPGRCLFVPLV